VLLYLPIFPILIGELSMKSVSFIALISCLMLVVSCSTQPKLESADSPASDETLLLAPSADAVKAHMAFLASDALQGREPGTKGYDAAADYVAAEFQKLGLSPGGVDQSFFQVVPLRRSYRNADKVQLDTFSTNGSTLSLEKSLDYVVSGSRTHAVTNITAEVVFVGYGLVAPEAGRDDYAGLDVEGKLVAMLARTPSGFQSEERALYGSRRGREASSRGALGIITLSTPVSEAIFPFSRLVSEGRLDAARMGWIESDGQTHVTAPNLKAGAIFSIEGAEKLFENAPVSWSDILTAAAKEGGVTPTFQLPVSMTIQQTSTMDEVQSANVIGIIEGSDANLKQEVLVLSAHLDHIGLSTTDEEDRINNGALDNAAGVATLLETARMLMELERPRRTILFLANTAEEKGLLGAEYFVKNPTSDHVIVANINLDMPILTYNFEDIIVFGGDRSTLRGAIQSAAMQMNIAISDDPFPEQGVFTRSDHFRFVEAGIPAVMLATGMANGGEEAWAEHFAKHYHQPSDDMDKNLDFNAAAKFTELNTRIALVVANADERPLWNKDDFFARQFKGPMQSE
jgi:Zn-dependent M28 family amino/carboxypeptidase